MASSRLRGGGGISFITSALVVVVLNGLVGTEGCNLGTRRGTAVAPLQLLSDCRTILARKLSIVLQGRFSSSSSSSILRALTVHHAGLRPALCVCFLPSVCLPPANAHEHCCCQLITQQQVLLLASSTKIAARARNAGKLSCTACSQQQLLKVNATHHVLPPLDN